MARTRWPFKVIQNEVSVNQVLADRVRGCGVDSGEGVNITEFE